MPNRRVPAFALVALLATALGAQSTRPVPRILTAIRNAQRIELRGNRPPRARASFDVGAMPGATPISGITLVFNRTPAQQAALAALLAAQQDPSSPQYHQWLTPAEFGARFGMSLADLAKVEAWLRQQGFRILSVPPSLDSIRFSGTAAQVQAAFDAPLHYFEIHGVRHFAPAARLSLPAAIAPTVLAIRGLDDFRPRPRITRQAVGTVNPNPRFTSSVSGNVFFAPGDIAESYDLGPLSSNGITGAGQTIAVIGQSAVALSDLEAFQSAAQLPLKDPNIILVPNSGQSAVFPSDEAESDLDLEWANATAPGATIDFVYVGSNQNESVFNALSFAVDQDLAPVISMSYGQCEFAEGSASINSTESILQQAATQGQTFVAPAGDAGSTDCSGVSGLTTAQQEALAVDYPASSAYAVGIGGTEVPSADLTTANPPGYWAPANGSDVLTSALKYIPETAWNDDSSSGISAGGGGASTIYTTKPSWQTGVPGIPADGKRDVPDLALYASPGVPGYLFCTSDQSVWAKASGTTQAQQASCNNGFRDSATEDLTVGGGTSFGVPIFAGMVALLNQAHGYTTGQGLANPTLYSLAANATTYAAAFHDITTGNNDCTAGATHCSGAIGFSAGTGYDQVTGLGSVDLNQLSLAWPANTAASANLVSTSTAITTPTSTPALNASTDFTIAVTPISGGATPTGTVTVNLDGTSEPALTLTANGTVVYSTAFTTVGPHQLLVEYAGDSTHAPSNSAITVTVPVPSSGKGSFVLSASNVSVAAAGSGISTITVAPSGGYTGTVLLTMTTSNPTALANLCFNFAATNSSGQGTVNVLGTTAATTQLTLDDNASDCTTGGFATNAPGGPANAVGGPRHPAPPRLPIPATAGWAALLALFLLAATLLKTRRSGVGPRLAFAALLAFAFAAVACGGSGFTPIGTGTTGGNANNPPAGTYTITVSGQDSTTSTITASTTFTFTIQ